MRILKPFRAAALAVLLLPGVASAEFDPSDNFDCATPPYAAICDTPLSPKFYTASADQNDFTIPWAFEADADIVVMTTTDDISLDDTVTWTTKTLTTHYTVSGEGGTSGTLSFTDTGCDATGTAGCTSGTTVLIYRDDAIMRTADFAATISSAALNLNFDRQTVWMQNMENILHRQTLRLPVTDYDKDTLLDPMTPNDERHALIVDAEADGFDWSLRSTDDWNCLECPVATCTGGTNAGDPCGADTDCEGTCTSSVCVDGADDGGACTTNADCGGVCSGDFTNCDYISVAGGELVCSNGTCPDSCAGDGGGGECDTCGDGQCFGGDGSGDGDACTDDADCPEGGTCGWGTCDGGANDGNPCMTDAQCTDGQCVFTGCLNCNEFEATCEEGQVLSWDSATERFTCVDIDAPSGICDGGPNDGNGCTDDTDCLGECSGAACVGLDLACSTNADCGGTCDIDTDVCIGGSGDGTACTQDTDCPEDVPCRPNTDTCWGGDTDGDGCTDDTDCTGLCTALACVGGPDADDVCATNSDCRALCVSPTDICNGCDGGGVTTSICVGGANVFLFCTVDADCPSSTCETFTCGECTGQCSETADCAGGCSCDVDNVCLSGPNDGDGCTDDTDCAGVCSGAACVDIDRACTVNADCGGVCAPEHVGEVCIGGSGDGTACTQDTDCPETNDCDFVDSVGVRGPSDGLSRDRSLAVWNGATGEFIEDTDVTLNPIYDVMAGLSSIAFQDKAAGQAEFVAVGVDRSNIPEDKAAFYTLPWRRPAFMMSTAGACTASLCVGGGNNGRACSGDADCAAADSAAKMMFVAGGAEGTSPNARTATSWTPVSYPIVMFLPGTHANNQYWRFYFAEAVNCPDDFAGSEVWNATTFTGSTTYAIKKNGSSIGTMIFDADVGPNEATTATTGGKTSFAAGDYMDIVVPASADATGGNISITLACVKVL